MPCGELRFLPAGEPMNTEYASPRYSDIDLWEPDEILQAMVEGRMTAVAPFGPHYLPSGGPHMRWRPGSLVAGG